MLTFITGSTEKFNEARSIIPHLELKNINLNEIQDLSPKAIIDYKIEEARKQLPKEKLIVEDVSLFVKGWKELPGPLIKWFLKALGEQGLYEWALKTTEPQAEALCTIAYFDGKQTHFFEGIVLGEIVKPKGSNGFGWDKIFKPNDSEKTFAEMSPNEKLAFSMRSIAFKKLKKHLETHS